MRYKLTIEYDGGPFHGFQHQPNLPTVQGTVEKALLKLTKNPVKIYGAGRTDQGVHALGQVAHMDLDTEWLPDKLVLGLNHFLKGKKVSIVNVKRVEDTFESRFGAKSKQYLYRLLNRISPPSFDEGRVWHVGPRLDVDLMHQGAQLLVGYHDFSSFRDSDCQARSALRHISAASVTKTGDEIHFVFEGRSFLHHQVRNMVGTLKLLGMKRLALPDITRILEAKNRTAAGPTAPPEGLYLVRIDYE